MKHSSPLLSSIVSLALLGACGGNETSLGDSYLDAQETLGQSFCRCSEALLEVPEEECRATYSGVAATPAQRDCVSAVLEGQTPAVTRVVECYRDATLEVARCMEENASCDEDAANACIASFSPASCGEVPDSVSEDLADCLE